MIKIFSALKDNRLLSIASILLFYAIYSHGNDFYGIDMDIWRRDADQIKLCISSWSFPCSHLSKFPLGYFFNSIIILAFQNMNIKIERSLTFINLTFISLPIVYIIINEFVRDKAILIGVYVVTILSSALFPFYVYSGSLELQSGIIIGLILSFICTSFEDEREVSRGLKYLCVFSGFMSSLLKDTNILVLPVVIVTGVGIFRLVYIQNLNVLKFIFRLRFILLGMFAGLVLQIGYNYLKYASPMPLVYLTEAATNAPSIDRSVVFLFFTFFSPNGGIIAFWGLATFLAIFLLHRQQLSISPASIIFSILLLMISAVGLSRWSAPFGWDCWGDRLIIPAVLGSLICIIASAGENFKQIHYGAHSAYVTKIYSHVGSVFDTNFLQYLFKLFILIFVSYSFYYTMITYVGDRDLQLKNSLFSFQSCRNLNEAWKLNPTGFDFWHSQYLFDCMDDRYMHVPRFVK